MNTTPTPASTPSPETPIHSTGRILTFDQFRGYSPIFVETGTAMGDGVKRAIAAGYDAIYSCEAHKPYYDHCAAEFAQNPCVHLYFGMSKDVLNEMIGDTMVFVPIVFWLDAHVSGPNSAGHEDYLEKGDASEYAQHKCLMAELDIIFKERGGKSNNHVLLIDDQNGRHEHTQTYIDKCLANNPNYKFYFYDEKRGETYYKDKILVCVP